MESKFYDSEGKKIIYYSLYSCIYNKEKKTGIAIPHGTIDGSFITFKGIIFPLANISDCLYKENNYRIKRCPFCNGNNIGIHVPEINNIICWNCNTRFVTTVNNWQKRK